MVQSPWDAPRCVLSGIAINGQSTTGPAILVTANGYQSRLSDIYFLTAGTIDVKDAAYVMLSNIYHLVPACGQNTYAIEMGDYNTLDHAIVNGGGALCHGIRANFGRISNAQVYGLSNANGITTTHPEAQVVGCTVYGLGTGTPYVLASGTIVAGNYPWADGLLYSNATVSGAVSNTTSETDFNKSYAIDPNRLIVGTVIRIRAQAFVTGATGGGTLNLRLKIGNTVIQATGAVTAASSFVGHFDSTLIVRTAGASGTIVGTTEWALGTYDAVSPKIGFLGSSAINTTVAQTVKVSAQWSVADAGNSVRLEILAVEILYGRTVG